jgi:hypothetical protein
MGGCRWGFRNEVEALGGCGGLPQIINIIMQRGLIMATTGTILASVNAGSINYSGPFRCSKQLVLVCGVGFPTV